VIKSYRLFLDGLLVALIEIMLLRRSSMVLVIVSCFQSLCINLQYRELEGGVEGFDSVA